MTIRLIFENFRQARMPQDKRGAIIGDKGGGGGVGEGGLSGVVQGRAAESVPQFSVLPAAQVFICNIYTCTV
jgi:hypothetical protein